MPKKPTIINPIDASFEDLTKVVVMKNNLAGTKDNTDAERTALLLGQAIGKRLTYKQ
tara:strand:- start:400 stop:570 length:171 start_codon:yes stop_codon:yes gene_type:complete